MRYFLMSLTQLIDCVTARKLLIGCWVITSIGYSVSAQSFEKAPKLAHCRTILLDSIQPVNLHQKLVNNSDCRINQIPDILAGSYFTGIQAPKLRIIPLTEGVVYVLALFDPVNKSSLTQLEENGFEPVEIDLSGFLTCQNQIPALFKKEIRYEKFRLKDFVLDEGTVAFFGNPVLPSAKELAQIHTEDLADFQLDSRKWQGCPSIEITGNKIWSAWFSGGNREPDGGNYGVVAVSDNKGQTWKDPYMIITHPNPDIRIMDMQYWKDPLGKLWIFWVQNTGAKGFDGQWVTWAIETQNPEDAVPIWSAPRVICNGLPRNKPIVLQNGDWILPTYDWLDFKSAVYASTDDGKTWSWRGGADNKPERNFFENMCIQQADGRIRMLQRNIQESYSGDNGKTWSDMVPLDGFSSANSRLYIGRLLSGNQILLYNNDIDKKRKNMTICLSKDDGKTWPFSVNIDPRDDVSYPDVALDDSGRIYIIYDRSRGREKEILMCELTEEKIELLSGKTLPASDIQIISKSHYSE